MNYLNFSNGNKPYINPVPGQIPIIALRPYPAFRSSLVTDFELMKDCGFNVIIDSPCKLKESGNVKDSSNPSESLINEDFDDYKAKQDVSNSRICGLRILLHSPIFESPFSEVGDDGVSFISEYKDCGEISGWFLADMRRNSALDNAISWIEFLYTVSADKMVLVVVNQPNFINHSQLTDESEAFLQSFQNDFQPSVWCYDSNPILRNGVEATFSNSDYYASLELFKKIATESGRPFWAFCQSTSCFKFYQTTLDSKQSVTSIERIPFTTESYLRFEAFTALAYGAQGILYRDYVTGPNTANETYYSALADKEGNPTPQWYAAQKVNSEISRFAQIFLDCKVESCVHRGNPIINGVSQKIEQGDSTFPPLVSINYNRDGIVLSHIRNQGHHYLLIVTHNPMIPQDVFIRFNANCIVKEITPSDIGNEDLTVASPEIIPEGVEPIHQRAQTPITTFNKRIAAGGYLLFKWF